ncbi:MAG: sulfatase [Spirosomataceae bacterium]
MKKIALLIVLLSSISTYAQQKPNVVVIFADDLGYGDLGCFGHPTIKTPNLDKMAQNGVKLTGFYAAANVCSPSRAALLTGRYPVRSGMTGERYRVLFPFSTNGLPKDEVTLPELLKPAGYATGMVGKWHMGHLPGFLPTDNGFDSYYGIPYSNDMGYEDTRAHPFKKMFPPLPMMANDKIVSTNVDQTQMTKEYTQKALEFIDKNKAKPFFLYYAPNFPHVPLYASDDFKGKSKRGLYGDVVEELDWSVGKILDYLKTNNLDKNTLVIFTSDNGPWLTEGVEGGSAGLLRNGKGTCWEGGMRVPFIAQWPGVIKPSQVIESLCTTMDLYTTIAGLAKVNVPSDRIVDGKDILPILTNKADKAGDEFFYYDAGVLFAVRKGPWKLHLKSVEGGQGDITQYATPMLFNLETDPSEKFNLSKENPETVKQLREAADKHLKSVEKKHYVFDDVKLGQMK